MKEKFWDKGIRFECQGTGRCCLSRGGHGFVYFTLPDRKRIAKHLGISREQFEEQYCQVDDEGNWSLQDPDKNCMFLEGKQCSVYEARPTQCRTWPFWPENMDAKTWDEDVVSYCPGVGKGKLYSQSEIKKLMDLTDSQEK